MCELGRRGREGERVSAVQKCRDESNGKPFYRFCKNGVVGKKVLPFHGVYAGYVCVGWVVWGW